MPHFPITVATILAVLSVFCVNGQTNSAQSCQTVTGMTGVNASLFAGHWYEEFRAPAINVSCVFVDVIVVNNKTQLNVTTNYSASKTDLLMNQFATAVVDINGINTNTGVNVSYSIPNTVTTLKILSTDYISYVALCGYTNSSNSSSFGIIATRDQIVNKTWLMELKHNASQILPVFNDVLASNITQSKLCRNSAASSLPALITLFTSFYALLKLTY